MRLSLLFLLLAGLSMAEEAKVRTLSYRLDTLAMEGVLVMPAGAKGDIPGLVLFPDWMGVGPVAVGYAKRVAEWGYAVLIADVYGKGVRPKDALEAGRISGYFKYHVPLLRQRGAAALSALKREAGIDTAKTGALGFCFGGGAALELARSGAPLEAVISVHGNLFTPYPNDAGHIRGKVLVLHGADDPYVLRDQVFNFIEQMRNTRVDWQLVHYGGAVHAFTNPDAGSNPRSGVAFNPTADRHAFMAMKIFLAEAL